uniref:Uncharacterized protein n=1 Tax=Jaculus jaculus TaxID=51337 RepID=A0A8C5KWL8_JACJA
MGCAAVLTPRLWRGSLGAISTQTAVWRLASGASRHLSLASIMKSRRKTDHLERTASVARREVVAAAKVCGVVDESPSVRNLRLLIADEDFSFKAGQ